jgi:RNA polymerase sigma-B factor
MSDRVADDRLDDVHDLELFREFVRTGSRETRNQLVRRHMGLAAHVATRFQQTSTTDDDLRQVAMLGLIKAVDRFDPEYGATFASFAGRTIEGELKRHFRDHTWAARVPRSAKELHLTVRRTSDDLAQSLGRSPTIDDLVEHTDLTRDELMVAMSASAAFRAESIDSHERDDTVDSRTERLGELTAGDGDYEHSDDRHVVEHLLARLSDRDRQVVRLRFYEERSQADIARIVGLSQMHVSRLLRQSFEQMRSWMDEEVEHSGAAT